MTRIETVFHFNDGTEQHYSFPAWCKKLPEEIRIELYLNSKDPMELTTVRELVRRGKVYHERKR